ncbi:MAG TPA: trigger factor [Candidatus Saccharimonadales bacterium]|nr:trigger factor [Candidatus Saccharimonadales bacterium]
MQVTQTNPQPTVAKLTISGEPAELERIKQAVLEHLAGHVKVQGFREGKAPANLIEKQLDPTQLQSEFLERAVNQLYVEAVQQQTLRPAAQPQITINKFVPFTTLEFTAEVDAVGAIKLGDYKKIKLAKKPVEVTAQDVSQVLDNLLARAATKQTVQRAAKDGDEVIINFKGVDAKTKQAIQGADGKEYPLTLGSNSFIPGFEAAVIGIEPGHNKTFELTFPKDYGVKDLQNRKVEFTVTVLKVNELVKPKLDDKFAATVGPFKTVAELKADIKKQLQAEREREAQTLYDNQLLEKIAAESQAAIPDSLIDSEIDRLEEEEKRNLVYRGQTWEEHLKAEGLTAEEHRQQKRDSAGLRVKIGLLLGEIAEQEGVEVTPEELEIRLQLLKGRYPDPTMQAELDKPENRQDIHSRLMTEKTIDKLRGYAQK